MILNCEGCKFQWANSNMEIVTCESCLRYYKDKYELKSPPKPEECKHEGAKIISRVGEDHAFCALCYKDLGVDSPKPELPEKYDLKLVECVHYGTITNRLVRDFNSLIDCLSWVMNKMEEK